MYVPIGNDGRVEDSVTSMHDVVVHRNDHGCGICGDSAYCTGVHGSECLWPSLCQPLQSLCHLNTIMQ